MALNNFMKILVITLLVAVVFFSGFAQKAQEEKVYKVGILSGIDFFVKTTDGFKEKMTELGYIDGKNIVYDLQKTNFDPEAEKRILKKFVDDKVDLIFVFPTEVSMLAKEATQGTGIPVVFANANIEGNGLVNSVREPGGNITGVRWPGPDLAAKRLEIMIALVPNAKLIMVPYQFGYSIVPSELEAMRPLAESAGINLIEVPASNVSDMDYKLKEWKNLSAVEAILMIPEPLVINPAAFESLAKFSAERRIPFGGAFIIGENYSTVFGLTPTSFPVGEQAAILADKILGGIPAGTIPVVSVESYFQLNYRAAQLLGLNVSEELLIRANEIIR